MNQKERQRQTVRAPNGMRVVLPRDKDPVNEQLKYSYRPGLEEIGILQAESPLARMMVQSGHTIVWGVR